MTLRALVARLLSSLGVEQRYILLHGMGVITARAAGTAMILLITLLVTRALGVADYGRFAFFLSVAFLAVLFGGLGLPVAVNRLLPRYLGRSAGRSGTQFFIFGLGLVFFGSLIAAVVAITATRSLAQAVDLLPFPLWSAALYVTGTALISFLAPVCRALDMPTTAALVDNIYPRVIVLAGMAALTLAGQALSLDSVLLLWVIGSYGTVAIAMFALSRNSGLALRQVRRLRWRQMRVWLSLSTTMMITPVFYFVLSETDILCLGLFATPRDVGIYNVARRLAELMQFAYVAVNTILLPRIAAAHAARDRERMQSIVDMMNLVVLLPATAVLLTLVVFGAPVLSLFGASFTDGYVIVLMLVLPRFLDLLLGPASEVLMMSGSQAQVARINIAAGVANLALNLLLVPRFGAAGAAAATAITMTGWKLVLFVLCRGRTGVESCLAFRLRHVLAPRPRCPAQT
jgi:O-antigen/teichoic acid export membrane protein